MSNSADLEKFYQYVQTAGELRTPEHAKRWSRAVLQELGFQLPSDAKKALSGALPSPLDKAVHEVFHLLKVSRNKELATDDFASKVARRGGNSDPRFAMFPIKAVMGAMQLFLNSDQESTIRNGLSPELRTVWDKAISTYQATL